MNLNRTPTRPGADESQMLRHLVSQLQAEKAELMTTVATSEARIQELLAKPKAEPRAAGQPGYWVITPSPWYSESVFGVRFSRGQGFIPEDEGAQVLALRMADELGYCVLYVADWQGPAERPDTANRPPTAPAERSERDELRELFAMWRPKDD